MENAVVALQHEVQRKVGRCMLRLQQYERLLKAMVASMAVAGPPEQLDAVRDGQADNVRNKTLGTLVGMFTEQHLTTASADIQTRPDEDAGANGRSSDASWASMSFTISMSPERYMQIKAGLAELVALRNDLVHHLIEKFNISTEDGCRATCSHLDSCYKRIDGHFQTLNAWAANIKDCQAQLLRFLHSETFEHAFVHDLELENSACRQMRSIVECLREAERACQVDGWVPLDVAVQFISKTSCDQTPTRYGCRTWRQVLQRSGQFELRSIAGSGDVKGQAWYRSVPSVGA